MINLKQRVGLYAKPRTVQTEKNLYGKYDGISLNI